MSGADLRRRRLSLGLTQAALAARLGISANSLARWERGEQRIGTPGLLDLALRQLEHQAHTDLPAGSTDHIVPRGNLPPSLGDFIGREKALADLRWLLARARLVTLTGAGGIGKTRLAVELARGVRDWFPDQVWIVDLATTHDARQVAGMVASALGITDGNETRPIESVANALHSRNLLLVLDNCERVAAACAEVVDRLLERCPRLRIVATSREPLGAARERVWQVPPMAYPTDTAPLALDGVGGFDAVQLFVDRARAAAPAFQVTEDNLPTIAHLCSRLDGMPLAIELAAARVRELRPEQIAHRLDDRFQLLVHTTGSPLPRHQTLRSSLDWSYDLLSKPEQQMLQRLAVFAGGWTAAAAVGVCAPSTLPRTAIVGLLDELVKKSLVALGQDAEDRPRYHLLETIHAYAREKLGRGAACSRLRVRHRDWFLEFAEQAEPHLLGPDQATWLAYLELEHDNLRAALELSIERRDAGVATRLGAALWRFWYVRGHFFEGRAWLDRALALPGEASRARVVALFGASTLSFEQGDLARGRQLAATGRETALELGDEPLAAITLLLFGNIARIEGNYAAARRAYKELADLKRRQPEPYPQTLPIALGALGHVELAEGRPREARRYYQEALAIEQAAGQRKDAANLLYRLGETALEEGKHAEARAHFEESQALALTLGDQQRLAYVFEGLAALEVAYGQVARARRLAGAAAGLRERIGTPRLGPERTWLERRLAPIGGLSQPACDLDEALALSRTPEPRLRMLPQRPLEAVRLTAREQQVAALVTEGLTNREIATALGTTPHTTAHHISSIMNKLGVHRRAQLAAHIATGAWPSRSA